MKLAVVVIPIYRDIADNVEMASLRQCLSVLHRYDICIVCHRDVVTSRIDRVISDYPQASVSFEYFDKEYFDGIMGYNKLCTSHVFYSRFSTYGYMLIYQLDCWVFKDELDEWCLKDYDYIGAPWMQCDNPYKGKVGNGGLSLRRIRYFEKVSRFRTPLFSLSWLIKNRGSNSLKKIFLLLASRFGYHNNLQFYARYWAECKQEDVIWSQLLKETNYPPRLPEIEVAMRFAIEEEPEWMISKLNGAMPFGLHAFYRFGRDQYWKQFIRIQ